MSQPLENARNWQDGLQFHFESIAKGHERDAISMMIRDCVQELQKHRNLRKFSNGLSQVVKDHTSYLIMSHNSMSAVFKQHLRLSVNDPDCEEDLEGKTKTILDQMERDLQLELNRLEELKKLNETLKAYMKTMQNKGSDDLGASDLEKELKEKIEQFDK